MGQVGEDGLLLRAALFAHVAREARAEVSLPRYLHQPVGECVVIDADLAGGEDEGTARSEARHRVDFQYVEVALFVSAEVHPGAVEAAQGFECLYGQ